LTKYLEQMMDLKDVCKLLKMTEPTVRKFMRKRGLPHFKIGGRVRFKSSEVIEWIEFQRVQSIDWNSLDLRKRRKKPC